MKGWILASASCAALLASPVAAQSTDPAPQSPPEQNSPQGAAVTTTTPETDQQTGIQDIVVTAQRVEENSQRAPIAISVLRPEELARQNVVRAEDLSRATPSLAAANAGGANTVFFIRGVGNFTVNAYSDPAVAFNYDGVYIGRPSSTSGTFFDLQRIEVLKGPQGTLYGRNATGGAINVIPNKPKPGVTEAFFTAGYGNYDAITGQAALNLPIGENGAVRFAGTYNRRDGFATDGTGDQREYGARAQLYAEPTDNFNIRIGADYSHQGGAGTAGYYQGRVAFNFPTGKYVYTSSGFDIDQGLHDPRSEAYLAQTFVPQAGRTSEPLNSYPYNNNGFWGVTGEINWSSSAGTLTIVPAYREAELNNRFTQPGMRAADTDESDRQTSVEARWAGEFGPAVDYIIGGYVFDEQIKSLATFNQLTLLPIQNFKTSTKSAAAFGKLSVKPFDGLTLTAAGRYTDDKKRFNGLSDTYIVFCGNPAPPQDFCPTLPLTPIVNNAADLRAFYAARGIRVTPVPLFVLPPQAGGSQTAPFVLNAQIPINSTLNNNKFTYRLAAQFDITTRNMIYASFETGYRSGGFSFARGLESYEPETIDAYTVGSKNRFLGNRVQLNVEGFYWKYRNQQFSTFGFDLGVPPATVFLTRNIGESTIKGVDVDLEVAPTRTTLLSGNLQYLDTNYDSFVYLTPNQGLPPQSACPFTPTTSGGNAVFSVDCSGRPAFNAPKWSLNLNAQQTVPLGAAKLMLQAGTRYRSSAYLQQDYQFWGRADKAWVSNASVTIATADDRLFATVWIDNIEDNRRLAFATQNQGAGLIVQNFERPRTYGLRVGGRF